MPTARVTSVNRGRITVMPGSGKSGRSAIDKRPVAGEVAVGPLGLDGDEVADKENHGGFEQAVYVYAREDLDWWAEQLGRELTNGIFGENITTGGIDVSSALIGERWQLGSAIVQITSPRIPCVVFRSWMDEPGWVKRFAAAGRPGAYLRVLTPGAVWAGADLEVLSRPELEVTIAEAMQAFYGDREIMSRLVQVEGRGAGWDEIAADQLSRA